MNVDVWVSLSGCQIPIPARHKYTAILWENNEIWLQSVSVFPGLHANQGQLNSNAVWQLTERPE